MKRSHQPRRSELSRRRTPRSVVRLHAQSSDRAFTLVEMMIAVALVLLIMTMFAEIFQIATSSLSKQRGLSENDQRARLLNTIVRADLDKRSFRDVIPFTSNQDTRQLGGLLLRRAGYWYYAENDPSDDTDDVLQFTTRVSNRSQSTDTTPYLGLAVPFSFLSPAITALDVSGPTFTVSGDYSAFFSTGTAAGRHIWVSGSQGANGLSNDGRYLVDNVSVVGGNTQFLLDRPIAQMATLGTLYLSEFQPELDDGLPGNLIGQSSAAEIAYYLRGGNLYRRVLLIRDADTSGAQPHLETGSPILVGDYAPSNGSFWRDFDYSAFYNRGNYSPGNSTGTDLVGKGPRFHTVSQSLNNDANAPEEVAFSLPLPLPAPLQIQDQFRTISLGIPQFRFGHDPWTGVPREFAAPGADGQLGNYDDTGFIGRFTMSECSQSAFGFPGTMSINSANPTLDNSPVSMRTTLNLDTNNAVSEFTTNPLLRRGADILMTNVLSFDVKVWDPLLGLFVDLGDRSYPTGSFYFSTTDLANNKCQNGVYSPSNKYRYDTWHPEAEIIQPGSPNNRYPNPPFTTQVNSVQITINYRDISSDQIRQVTIVQSLIDPN